jgi:hypothetical protein
MKQFMGGENETGRFLSRTMDTLYKRKRMLNSAAYESKLNHPTYNSGK